MPADRKQVEEAVERLTAKSLSVPLGGHRNFYDWTKVLADDLRLLLTDHAALLARAEAAEKDARKWRLLSCSAHQQPAPVKAGGEENHYE